MKISPRSQKLGGVLMELLPPILQKMFTPNQVGFLTVTAVEVSGDLGVADVFVSSIGGGPDVLDQLNRSIPKITREITPKLQMRRVIVLRFKLDKSAEAVRSVQKNLKEV